MKLVSQPIKDRLGVIDYVSSVHVTYIDKTFDSSEKEFVFPLLLDTNTEAAPEKEFIGSANKIIETVGRKIENSLRRSTMVFVQTKRDKLLLQELTDAPIHIID